MGEIEDALGDASKRVSLSDLQRQGRRDIKVIRKEDLIQFIETVVRKAASASNLSEEKTNLVKDELIQVFGDGVDKSFLDLRNDMRALLSEMKSAISSGPSYAPSTVNKIELQEQKLQGLFNQKAEGTIYAEMKNEVDDVSSAIEKLKKMRGG